MEAACEDLVRALMLAGASTGARETQALQISMFVTVSKTAA